MVSRRFSGEPVLIAASTSSTMDKVTFGIAHPERSGAVLGPIKFLYRQ
jgi:hypothetical protein